MDDEDEKEPLEGCINRFCSFVHVVPEFSDALSDFSMHLTCFLRIICPLCCSCKKERRNAI